jgi:hypothetical protein
MSKKIFIFIIISLIGVGFLFFLFKPPESENITWGINFSQKHAYDLGLNWQETYLAMLDDLKVKNVKLLTHWDLIEPDKDWYFFDDLDWQIAEAEKRNVKIALVIGMKTGRWPECHIPEWAKSLNREKQQKEILELIENIVLRYKGSESIKMWQPENEPFFTFGVCPWQYDEDFLEEEVKLIKSLDEQKRPVVVTDSGEFSFWLKPAKLADIVGITMYKKVWSKELKSYLTFPYPPAFYWLKAKLVDKFFKKKVIVVELQAEPWGKKLLYDSPPEEQKKTMNLNQFRKNINFAKKTGFDEFYLWGLEWWYWLKKNFPDDKDAAIWEEARNLFSRSNL